MKRKKKIHQQESWSHKHDFPVGEVWNTKETIARLIVPRLKAFRALDKHGYAGGMDSMEAWNKALDKMIYAFEIIIHAPGSTSEQERISRKV